MNGGARDVSRSERSCRINTGKSCRGYVRVHMFIWYCTQVLLRLGTRPQTPSISNSSFLRKFLLARSGLWPPLPSSLPPWALSPMHDHHSEPVPLWQGGHRACLLSC